MLNINNPIEGFGYPDLFELDIRFCLFVCSVFFFFFFFFAHKDPVIFRIENFKSYPSTAGVHSLLSGIA